MRINKLIKQKSLKLLSILFLTIISVTNAQTVGPTVPSSFTNKGNWNDFSNFDRSFTVISSITLKSVKVIPADHWSLCPSGGTSSLTVDLYKDGVRIDDVTATVNCGAVNTIDLNFELLSGFYELRIRNVDNGQIVVSNDASEKSITNVILLNEQTDGFSGAFFDWVVESKTGPVIPLPDTVRLCPGQTYDLNFGAYNGERWTSDESFTTIDDANIRLEPTQSTVYYFEKPTLIPAGQNIVQNGDLEAGNTGFTSEYNLNTALTSNGDYMVGNNSSIPISVGADYNPGTTSGKMLVTNSTPSGSGVKNAWCQTVDVYPNTTYQAEFRVKAGVASTTPFVTGSFNGGNWKFENTSSTWALYQQTWNSGSNTTLDYCIQNHKSSPANIMLIDDIRLLSANPILAYTAINQVVVIVESSSNIDLGADENNCNLSTTPVTLDAGADWDNYTWSPGGQTTQTISVNSPGTYSVTTSKSGGCSGAGNITFTANACASTCTDPIYSMTTGLQSVCQGDTANFDLELTAGTAPLTLYYSIDGIAQTSLTGLTLGTHVLSMNSTQSSISVDSVSGGGCTVDNIVASSGISTVNPLPIIDLGTTTTLCDDGSTPLTLDARNTGATFSWSPNNETAQTISVNSANTYKVTVTDGNNCLNTESITITEVSCGCPDNDSDGICDDVDLDDDNDGILDVDEYGYANVANFLWSMNNGSNKNQGIAQGEHASFAVTPLPNQTFGSGITISTPSSALIIDNVNTTSAANALAAGDYIEYTFTTNAIFDETDRFHISRHVYATSGNAYDFSILVSTDGGTTFPTTLLSSSAPGGARAYYGDNFSYFLEPSTTYTIRKVLYNAVGSILIDDVHLHIARAQDTDNDGIRDYLDLDSDNDGCPDALEGTASFTNADISNSMLTGGIDANGVPTVATTSGQGLGTSQDDATQSSACCDDFDNDGVCDDVDLDDDNDGILDEIECNFTGVNDFQWSSVPTVSGNSATGTINGITYTYSSTTPVQTTSNIFSHSRFPSSFNIPNTTSIKNVASNTNTLTFDTPVLNPVLIFSSIGNSSGLSVPIDFNNPVEVLWSTAVVQNSPTRITGTEGYAIVRMNGIFSSISFNYLAAENYANFMFGGDFVASCGTCDIDNDTKEACFDLDSDGDGCPDALEGDGGILPTQLDANGMITGGVDANGIPTVIGPSGQNLGSSLDSTTSSNECNCNASATFKNIPTSICDGDTAEVIINFTGTAPFNLYYTSSIHENLESLSINTDSIVLNISQNETILIDSIIDNSCTNTDTSSITISVQDIPTINGAEDSLCGNGSMNISANTNNGTIHWYTDSIGGASQGTGTNFTTPALTSTTKFYAQSFASGCGSNRIEVIATINPIPLIDLGNDTIICENENISLTVGNHLSISWNTPLGTYIDSSSLTVSNTGNYLAEVSNGFCTNKDSIEITIQSNPQINLGKDTSLCDGQVLTLDASTPNSTYLWSTNDSSPTLGISTSGEYFAIITDNIGCIGRDTINVTVNPMPSLELGNDTIICQGSSLLLDAQNSGFSYEWSTLETTSTVSITTANTYSVKVSSSEHCFKTDSIKLTIQPTPSVDLGGDTEICIGQSHLLHINNPSYSILWSDNSINDSLEINTQNNYNVTVTDSVGCQASDNMFLTVHNLPLVSITLPDDICYESERIEIIASPQGGTFNGTGVENSFFNPKNTSLTSNLGTYVYYDFTDQNNCSNRDSSFITLRKEPIITFPFNDSTICDGDELTLSGITDINSGFEWIHNGEIISNLSFTTTSIEGEYIFKSTSDFNCISIDTIRVTVQQNPIVDLGRDQEFNEGNHLVLDAGLAADYYWSTNEVTQTIKVTNEGTYEVLVTDSLGCTGTDEVFVDMIESIVVPNTFTPNNDGDNDVWIIDGIDQYDNIKVQIFNRWGNLVNTQQGIYEPWDGTYKGDKSAEGVYFYVISVGFKESQTFKGSITLLR